MESKYKCVQEQTYFKLWLVTVSAFLIGQLAFNQPYPALAAVDATIIEAESRSHSMGSPDSHVNTLALNPSVSQPSPDFESVFVEAEDLSRVIYGGTGWSTVSCTYCSGGQYRRTDSSGRTATLVFEGTSISVVFVADGRSGIAEIRIDGLTYPAVNLYNNATGRENPDPIEYVIATDLSPGQHTIEVEVTGQDGYNHPNGWSTDEVGLDGFRYGDFPFGSLQGRVLDPDGDGVSGAWIEVKAGSETYIVGAAYDGVFTLSGLPSATYSVTASVNGYRSQTVEGVVVNAGSETGGIDITVPETAGHVLYGHIYRPHMNSPAIAPIGTTLDINVKEGSNAAGWSASLSTTHNTFALPLISASYDPISAWTLQVNIPADTPAELYDLTVSSSLGADTQVRAVQVVTQYDDPFYFVVLGDPQAATVQSGQPIFEQIVDEINLINPVFVLAVGDLMEDGNVSQYESYVEAINRLQVPSYGVPGNHDFLESSGVIPQLALWKEYLGRRFHSFDYDLYHITGIDNSAIHVIDPDLIDVGGYFADHVAWAQADLAANQSSLLRFLFFHIARQLQIGGDALPEWKPSWIDELNTNLVLYGHAGADLVEISGETPVHWVETDDMIEQTYRLVRVENGQIVSYTYNGSDKHGIPSGLLNVNYSPDNDGSHDTVTATVENNLQEHFEHSLLRFVMPRYNCYETNRGLITQLVDSDDGLNTVVYVTLDVPTNADTTITVAPCFNNADLGVTGSVSSGPAVAGSNLVFNFTVTNNGPFDSTGVMLRDILPEAVTFVSASSVSNCAEAAGIVTCQLATLDANDNTQVTITVSVDPLATGVLTNFVTVAGDQPDLNPENDTITTTHEIVRPSKVYLPLLFK